MENRDFELKQLALGNEKFEKKGRTIVNMGDGAGVEIPPNGEDKELYTFGLNGCTATAIISEYEDGSRRGVMTHYDVMGLIESSRVLQRELITDNLKGKSQAKIFVRGDYAKVDEKWKLVPDVSAKEELRLIELNLKNKFGENVSIEIVPYSERAVFGERREISFTIKSKRPGTNTPATIYWWGGKVTFDPIE